MGRPNPFHPKLCEEAHNYCLLGATNDELAELFAVSPRTIDSWIARHRDFARVARGLYARAVGYECKVERAVILGGELKPTDDPSTQVDDIALLDAAGESRRYRDGD